MVKVTKRKVKDWKAEDAKYIRPGYKRFTTYCKSEYIDSLKKHAALNQTHVMDILDDLIGNWQKKNGKYE